MQSKSPQTVLTQTISEVLSGLAFLFSDDSNAEPSAPIMDADHEQWIESVIQYNGSSCGELRILCAPAFARLLATNMLGDVDSGPDGDESAFDAFREFSNVLCGRFVTSMYGDEDVFDFSIPTIGELASIPVFSFGESNCDSAVTVEGHRLRVIHRMLEFGALHS